MRTKTSTSVREQPTFIEAARRLQIIEAAIETIAELGFMNASLAQIAKRAGISKGVIGYYFPSKDDLVRKAVDHFYGSGHESMVAQVKEVTSATETLRIYIASNVDFIVRNKVATIAMGEIMANFRGPDGQPVFKAEDEEPLILATKALFDWGQQAGEFRLFDSRIMAVTLRRAIDGFADQFKADPQLDVARYVSELTQLFIEGTRNTATIPSVRIQPAPVARTHQPPA